MFGLWFVGVPFGRRSFLLVRRGVLGLFGWILGGHFWSWRRGFVMMCCWMGGCTELGMGEEIMMRRCRTVVELGVERAAEIVC